jgi:TorA maturation chaperone TorD
MELVRALAIVAEPPTDRTSEIARLLELGGRIQDIDYTELFVFQLNPCASIYTGDEGAMGGEARDRVAGFWSVIGLVPPAEPDHLATLLGLYAEIADHERGVADARGRAALARARAALLWEHLLSWLGPYLRKMEAIATPPYADWARLLRRTLWSEASAMPSATGLPLHLRSAAGLPDAAADLDTWCAALLAPVRSGIVLTRADLARGAAALGLGLRAGERRYALRALFSQDADAVSDWLADEALSAAAAYDADTETLGAVAGFWSDRARRTADALRRSRQ